MGMEMINNDNLLKEKKEEDDDDEGERETRTPRRKRRTWRTIINRTPRTDPRSAGTFPAGSLEPPSMPDCPDRSLLARFDRSESPPIFGPAREQPGGMFQKLQVLIDRFLDAGT